MSLKPIKYQYRPKDDYDIYIEWKGSGWAITREAIKLCFNKDGCWECEPQLSSRTEEFFRRCRYETVEEAVAHIEKHYPVTHSIQNDGND